MSTTNCENCKTAVPSESKFCPKCHFPEHGSLAEQEDYYDDYNKKLREAYELEGSVEDATTIFLYMGLASAGLGGSALWNNSIIVGSISIVIGMALVAIFFTTPKKPFKPLLTAFICYVILTLLVLLIDGFGFSFFSRVAISIIIGRSTYHAYQLTKINEDLEAKR